MKKQIKKKFKLKGVYAVKVNYQEIVIICSIDEEGCIIMFIDRPTIKCMTKLIELKTNF